MLPLYSVLITMSFEALPDELLEEIFSHLGGKQRVDLSLVNRRWFRILTTLRFSQDLKLCLNQRSGLIPVNVLFNSDRVYQHIYFSITDESDVFVRFIIADLLHHCVQRWNVQSLQIHAYYDRLLLFLQDNRDLLEGLQALFLRVENVRLRSGIPSDSDDEVPVDDHLVLQLENLQILHWSYTTAQWSHNAHHILSFVTPQLTRLEMCHSYTQPGFLESVYHTYSRMYICPMLKNLQELYLRNLIVKPTEFQLELPQVRKLTLEAIPHRGSLVVLSAPRLIKLITDFRSITALRLSDINTLRHVEFHLCRDCDDVMMRSDARRDMGRFFENYANQVTKLTLVSHVEDTPFEQFSFLLECFPKIESLHLHQFSLPSSMDQRGPLLKVRNWKSSRLLP